MTGATARVHQPGQSAFRAILPEQIDWRPFAAFPPAVRLAVLVGEPAQPGPYTIRVKVAAFIVLAIVWQPIRGRTPMCEKCLARTRLSLRKSRRE